MINVLMSSQTRLISTTLQHVLEEQSDMHVIGHESTIEGLERWLDTCDLLIIYPPRPLGPHDPPTQETLSLIKTVKSDYEDVKVLVVGLPYTIPVILCYLEAGADGYVLNKDSVGALLKKTRAVWKERPIISPQVAAALMGRVTELANGNNMAWISNPQQALAELTDRELEVLELLGFGLKNQEIAQRLVIQPGTVKNHVHHILKKLNVANRQEATAYIPFLVEQP